ncbi:MAG: S-layer protein, partial [Planctomycetaceae bacterium]
MSVHSLIAAAILPLTMVFVEAGEATIDFDNEILPIFTKAGCNTGACHGAAVGRGGFRLSLYGGDPASDYQSIVLELEGRRVNPAQPEESLVVLKPTESVSHEGGTRLEYDGDGANLLTDWIRQGTPRPDTKRLEEFQVSPKSYVADQINSTLQLTAKAKFNNGTVVDVTHTTVFTAEDPSAVAIDPQTASAKLLRRGRHIVVARYLDRVVPLELIVPLADDAIDLSTSPRHNFIDDEILR